MQALCRAYCMAHNVTPRAFFYGAFKWSTGKEPADTAIDEAVQEYHDFGNVPEYACELLARVYGT